MAVSSAVVIPINISLILKQGLNHVPFLLLWLIPSIYCVFFHHWLAAVLGLRQGDVPEVCQEVPAPGGVLCATAHLPHPVDGAAQKPTATSGVRA